MSGPQTQERVRLAVAEHPEGASSKQVAQALDIQTGWACHILSELVARGVVDVRNADGGEYRWSVTT